MKKGKTSRLHGMIAKFYQAFWDVIGLHLLRLAIYAFEKGSFHSKFDEQVIKLMHKTEDREDH